MALMARKESPVKTNAARILDAAGVHYELREYTVDEDDLSAPRVAEKIGAHAEGILLNRMVVGSSIYDAHMYSLLPSDFGLVDRHDAAQAVRSEWVVGIRGVVVARGAIGNPWIFRELAAAERGLPPPPDEEIGSVRNALAVCAPTDVDVESAVPWHRSHERTAAVTSLPRAGSK